MTQPDEENFPRGGKIIRKRHVQDSENLFNVERPPQAKKAKTSKKKEVTHVTEDIFQSSLSIKGSLTYNKIQTGMVILGCIRNITNFSLEVELPGLCFCLVNITEISDSFTKYLNQQLEVNNPDAGIILSKMFTIGEFLPVKITGIKSADKRIRLEGTLNPNEINSEQNHNSFKKGMLIWGAISSEADHGFEISLGVKNCRTFLPFKNVEQKEKLVIGKPLWCVVHRNDSTATSTILRVSIKREHTDNTSVEVESLHNLIPGSKVEFLVEKVTAHGIQGKFSEKFVGYVDENFLAKPLKKLSDYREGKLLVAYVLYIEPATKITHLTLRNLEISEKPDITVGNIVQGEVFSKSFNGIIMSFSNKNKAFVTNKRLLNTLPKKDNVDVSEAVNKKFAVGSKHQCRVLDYNHMSKMFICTPEFSVVKDSNFSPKDLIPGQLLKVTINTIKEEGLVVTSGHVRGFVPNLHISNLEYTENCKKRFKEGQRVNARVLSIEDNKILFTMKPSLVENEDCLTKLEDAEIGKKFPGVVAKLTDTGCLVVFYGNVRGWLNHKMLVKQNTNPSKFFFLGQVVNSYILKVKGSNINLSISKPSVNIAKIGNRFIGTVVSINERGINIKIENSQQHGFLPNSHLCSSLSLCNAVKNTFKEGDKITNLIYVGGINPPIYSKRESSILKNDKVPRFKNLKEGSLIRTSYESTCDEGIYVLPLISDYNTSSLIPKKHLSEANIPGNFAPYQAIQARVESIDHEKKQLTLAMDLNSVFDQSVESIVDYFTSYLINISYLRLCGRKKGWNLCQYNCGERVSCKVEKLGEQGGCVASLPNGVQGVAVPSLCPKNIKEGDELTATVISHDYDKNFVDICLRPDISTKINVKQYGKLDKPVASAIAEKLLVKDDYVIAVLKHSNANKQLVYLPTRVHENDFEGCSSYYNAKKFKVCVCGTLKRNLIGISKKQFLKLDKKNLKHKMNRNDDSTIDESKLKKPESKNKKVVEVKQETEYSQAESEFDSGIEHTTEVDLDSDDSTSEDDDPQVKETQYSESNKISDTVTLPGISSFFNTAKREAAADDSSSEDEEIAPTEKKKKKLSPAERAELLKQKEEKISKIEKDLADPNKAPESAEQFDRLLLNNPNSSILWTKYISFHIAATEIDKARAVAKRALDTINMTLTEEKFNIWIVLLNLENTYGTKESFDKVLEDALIFNDSLQIYLKVIQILAEDGKFSEMEEKVRKLRNKHKQEPIMWLELAKTYYQIGKFKEARNCKDCALKSIPDKKTQMNLIIRFAIMEFKFGEADQGCAIFETILMSDPRKVNIWITYVDQLIKKGHIEQARQVLERSVGQKLPIKSMKSLFMKLRKFEEEHGTAENVESVKRRAQEYVAKFE